MALTFFIQMVIVFGCLNNIIVLSFLLKSSKTTKMHLIMEGSYIEVIPETPFLRFVSLHLFEVSADISSVPNNCTAMQIE